MTGLSANDWRQLHGGFFQDQRVLITGGAGFIGSHLADALLAVWGRRWWGPGRSERHGRRENLQNHTSLTFVEGSILDRNLLQQVVAGCSYVFHEAALGSVPASVELPLLYNDVNTTGTLNVLGTSRRWGSNGCFLRPVRVRMVLIRCRGLKPCRCCPGVLMRRPRLRASAL